MPPADDYRRSLSARSDDELAALEKDRALPTDEWAAVEAERARRASSGGGDASRGRAPMPPASGTRREEDEAEPSLAEALRQLRALLVPGETLEAYAVQRRLFSLTHRRVIVAATTGRYIVLTRGLFGGYTPLDVRWQDLHDASVRAGVFGATLSVSAMSSDDLASAPHGGRPITVIGLRKDDAQAVYRVCQSREQAWREKRRVRDLDEMRARSGGIQLGAAGGAAGGAPMASSAAVDPAERLLRAKEMLDGGLITDAEYESIKARVVDAL